LNVKVGSELMLQRSGVSALRRQSNVYEAPSFAMDQPHLGMHDAALVGEILHAIDPVIAQP